MLLLLLLNRIYELTPKLCKHCHHECDETCTGPGPGNCTVCKHVKDGPYCVPACPTSKFNDSGECMSCHENCVGGCTGPENNIGPRGCRSCEKAVINGDVEVVSIELLKNLTLTRIRIHLK
jgi:epidermal growth factor receptor